jgi:cobalt-zinc-cadmium efflux system membrane fusion protein
MKLPIIAALLLAATAANAAQPLGCLIEPEQVADVGSQVIGVIDAVHVDRGAMVKKGQIVATLRADVERAALGVARSKAEADAEVRAATANVDLARQQLSRAEDLFNKNFVSEQAVDKARSEHDIAVQKLAQAREQQRIWQRELGLANAQLEQRVIRSPIDGVVVERFLNSGERIEQKPALRVATIDPLRVEVVVPASMYGSIQPGITGNVRPDLPNATPLQATVTLVDRVIDAASNTFRVRLQLPNPNLAVPAGARCRADFGPAVTADASPRSGSSAAGPSSLKAPAAASIVR